MATLDERFWSKVDKDGPIPPHRPDLRKCWTWTAYRLPNGYGRFWVSGQKRLAHRVSWEITHGPVPEGEGYHGTCVLHECDNRACVNPAHLFLGSNTDNVADMVAKSREARGETNASAKLSLVDIPLIREAAALGISAEDMARDFGVNERTICDVISGRRWAWVPRFIYPDSVKDALRAVS